MIWPAPMPKTWSTTKNNCWNRLAARRAARSTPGTAPAPAETVTPLPSRQGFFDGQEASAAAVGQGDLPTETEILLSPSHLARMTGRRSTEEEE